MKIIAQSEVPQKIPYIHLGYLAATVRTTSVGLLSLGLAMVCLGILVARNLQGVWSGDLKANFSGTSLRRKAGFLLIAFGVVFLFLSPFAGPPTRPGAATITRHSMEMLALDLATYLRDVSSDSNGQPAFATGAFLGTGITNAFQAWPDYPLLDHRLSTDGWGRAISFQFSPVSNQWLLTFTSAGADGRFNTPDDISQTNLISGR
jgi:hypothetical protein